MWGVSGRALFCEIDGRVLGGNKFGVLWRGCFARLRLTGRVLGDMSGAGAGAALGCCWLLF